MRSSIAISVFVGCLALSLDARGDTTQTMAAFVMPADFDNWKPDIVGRNGMYRFRQSDGKCQITFAQNRGAGAARAAGRDPRDTLDAYIGSLTAKVGEVRRSEAPALELPLATGEKVRFISEEIAYTGDDNVAYHNRISTQ
jgi:hypothetical protein